MPVTSCLGEPIDVYEEDTGTKAQYLAIFDDGGHVLTIDGMIAEYPNRGFNLRSVHLITPTGNLPEVELRTLRGTNLSATDEYEVVLAADGETVVDYVRYEADTETVEERICQVQGFLI